ncbi:hypothetical protein GUJ93_ZPchr0012g18886 [Zizania palustris]|uniref:Uncharacterized protein n=1 Tax=Zizania palustris TaxID=103762 RepID=A0A8J5WQU8_ZIZPA|nr:hypothetical protein GUJ93_ZPchr0012g18886 [Zizania palustris]
MSPLSSSSVGTALGGSHAGLALAATAMALSGTLVLFSLCRAKPHRDDDVDDGEYRLVNSSVAAAAPLESPARLRPCLSSSEKRKREKARRRSNKKRVRFADGVVVDNDAPSSRPAAEEEPSCRSYAAAVGTTTTMPANREALYRGMLRGRSMLRVACSY